MIHGKIFFSPFVASPLKGKNPIPIPPNYGIKPFPGFERKLTSKLSWGKFHILGGLVTKDSTRPGVIGISYPAWSSRRVSLEFPTRPGHHAGCHWNFPPGLVKVIPTTIKKSFLLNWHIFHWQLWKSSITITKTNEKLFWYMFIESFNQALGDWWLWLKFSLSSWECQSRGVEK